MSNPLLWLSGVDRDLLSRCVRLPGTEHGRFSAFGGLVLIPATIGLVAMGYGCYTFLPDYRVAVIGGVLWFLIVMWVDRLISMTLFKSSVVPPYSFWGGFVVRLLLAGVIGYGLAHPSMLLLFRQEIDQQIRADAATRQQAALQRSIDRKSKAFKELNNARSAAIQELSAQLADKTEQFECKSALIQLEQAGGVAPGTPVLDRHGRACGYASGIPLCESRCEEDKRQARELRADIDAINKQIAARLAALEKSGASAELGKAIQASDKILATEIDQEVPTDYASRTAALTAIETKHPDVRAVRTFLVVFLVILDTLIISLKAIVPKGEYEELRDVALCGARVTASAEREATHLWASRYHKNAVEARLRHEEQKNEMAALLSMVNAVIREQCLQFEVFEDRMRMLHENVSRVRDDATKNVFLERLTNIRDMYSEAWLKATLRIRNYIGSL